LKRQKINLKKFNPNVKKKSVRKKKDRWQNVRTAKKTRWILKPSQFNSWVLQKTTPRFKDRTQASL